MDATNRDPVFDVVFPVVCGTRNGTAFPIWVSENATWFVTCDHVIEPKKNQEPSEEDIKVNGQSVEKVIRGGDQNLDLALLRLSNSNQPSQAKIIPLRPAPLRSPPDYSKIPGFYKLDLQNRKSKLVGEYAKSPCLGEPYFISSEYNNSIRCWKLSIDGDVPLVHGYSGAPVLSDAETNRVYAVAAINKDEGKIAIAICISELARILPDELIELRDSLNPELSSRTTDNTFVSEVRIRIGELINKPGMSPLNDMLSSKLMGNEPLEEQLVPKQGFEFCNSLQSLINATEELTKQSTAKLERSLIENLQSIFNWLILLDFSENVEEFKSLLMRFDQPMPINDGKWLIDVPVETALGLEILLSRLYGNMAAQFEYDKAQRIEYLVSSKYLLENAGLVESGVDVADFVCDLEKRVYRKVFPDAKLSGHLDRMEKKFLEAALENIYKWGDVGFAKKRYFCFVFGQSEESHKIEAMGCEKTTNQILRELTKRYTYLAAYRIGLGEHSSCAPFLEELPEINLLLRIRTFYTLLGFLENKVSNIN